MKDWSVHKIKTSPRRDGMCLAMYAALISTLNQHTTCCRSESAATTATRLEPCHRRRRLGEAHDAGAERNGATGPSGSVARNGRTDRQRVAHFRHLQSS